MRPSCPNCLPTKTEAAVATKAPASTPASAAAATKAPATSAPAKQDTVKVMQAKALAEAGMYLAMDRGYFTNEGIQLQLVPMDAAARAIPTLGAGELDAANGTLSEGLLNAIDRNVDVKIGAGVVVQAPNASLGFLVLRKDLADSGEVKGFGDLKGKKISVVSKRSTLVYSVGQGLKQASLTIADVEFVELGFPEQVTALANKAVDVAYLSEPFAQTSVERGIGTKWKSQADMTGTMTTTFMQLGAKSSLKMTLSSGSGRLISEAQGTTTTRSSETRIETRWSKHS